MIRTRRNRTAISRSTTKRAPLDSAPRPSGSCQPAVPEEGRSSTDRRMADRLEPGRRRKRGRGQFSAVLPRVADLADPTRRAPDRNLLRNARERSQPIRQPRWRRNVARHAATRRRCDRFRVPVVRLAAPQPGRGDGGRRQYLASDRKSSALQHAGLPAPIPGSRRRDRLRLRGCLSHRRRSDELASDHASPTDHSLSGPVASSALSSPLASRARRSLPRRRW